MNIEAMEHPKDESGEDNTINELGKTRNFIDKTVAMAAGAAIFAGASAEAGQNKFAEDTVPVTKVVTEQKILNVKPSEKIFVGKYADDFDKLDRSKLTEAGSAWASELLNKLIEARVMIHGGTDAMSYLKAGYGAFARHYEDFVKTAALHSPGDHLFVAHTAQILLINFEEALDSNSVNRTNMSAERSYMEDCIKRCMGAYDRGTAANDGPKFKF